MAYNPSTPNSTDLISATQAPIKENFFQLNDQFKNDHNAFDSVAANGHHKQITFDAAIAAPGPAGTVSNIYPANDSATIVYPYFKNATVTRQLAGGTYTYTPTIAGSGITYTITSQTGKYYVSGGVIYFFGTIVASNTGSGSSFTISLPTTASASEAGGAGSASFSGVATGGTIAAGASTMIVTRNITASVGSVTYIFSGFYI